MLLAMALLAGIQMSFFKAYRSALEPIAQHAPIGLIAP